MRYDRIIIFSFVLFPRGKFILYKEIFLSLYLYGRDGGSGPVSTSNEWIISRISIFDIPLEELARASCAAWI